MKHEPPRVGAPGWGGLRVENQEVATADTRKSMLVLAEATSQSTARSIWAYVSEWRKSK